MSLDQLFDQFLRERTYVHNVTSKTRDCYQSAWHAFKQSQPLTPAEITKADLLAFVVHLRERGVKPVSCVTRLRPDGSVGPGLRPRPDCGAGPVECERGGSAFPNGGKAAIRGVTISQLADGMLSTLVQAVVRDESNIAGVLDLELSWRPATASADANDPRPALFTAIEEQLGLKLNATRRPVDGSSSNPSSDQRPTDTEITFPLQGLLAAA